MANIEIVTNFHYQKKLFRSESFFLGFFCSEIDVEFGGRIILPKNDFHPIRWLKIPKLVQTVQMQLFACLFVDTSIIEQNQ